MRTKCLFDVRSRGGLRGPRAGFLCLCWAAPAAAQCVPAWSGLNGGLFGESFALATADDDAAGPRPVALFVGGAFHTLAWVPAERIARWDGWTASAVGAWPHIANEGVEELHGYAAAGRVPAGLYAGGHFTTAGGPIPVDNLARWLAPAWFDVGGGVTSPTYYSVVFAARVLDLGTGASRSPALHAGGYFEVAGGVPVTSGAVWDGSSWSPLGTPLTPWPGTQPSVWTLAQYDDDGPGPRQPGLYAGGSFRYAGGVEAWNIARWDGAAWEPLNLGASDAVTSLCVFDEDGPGPGRPALFAGGFFTAVGGPVGGPNSLTVVGLARWDGQQWSRVGGWQHGGVRAMAVYDEDGPGQLPPSLYVGGFWVAIPGHPAANRVARWDGSQWHVLGAGVGGASASSVEAMAVFDEDGPGPNPGGLYVAGRFYYAAGIESWNIARWGCPLPPTPCYPDCNADGTLNLADLGCFQTKFATGNAYADCNSDGALNLADFGCFQTRFALGC
jgi:hypothetical protein